MIRIDYKDLVKAMKLLEKDSMQGPVKLEIKDITFKLTSMDRSQKEMVIELFDVDYPTIPRLTKTETF